VISLERFIERLPSPAYLCDADGYITKYNALAEELWGRAPALRSPEDRYCGSCQLRSSDGRPLSHEQCWMARALKERRPFAGKEVHIRRPDGDWRVALTYVDPLLDEHGELKGAVNVLVDLTAQRERERVEQYERKAQEQQLMTYQRLAVFGQLAAGFAHEVRNPLAVIQSAAQLALKRQAAGQSGIDEQLEAVLRQTGRLKALMEDVLQHAKSSRLAPGSVDPCAVMERAVEQALQQFGPQGARVKVELSCAVGRAKVRVTEERLLRLLSNLALNALQAMAETGGRLIARAEIECGQALLRIEDDGPGFAPGALERLFEPFFTTKPTGSGLGLWIAQSLAQEMGGSLHADTAEPRGAVFTLSLPLAPEA
jgi:signal transduction histidine kinase